MKQKLRNLMVVSTAIVGCWSGNAWAQEANVWVAPQVPGVDVSTLDQTEKSTNDCVYTYNIGADAFLTYGMNWNTNAIATRLTDNDKTADLPHATWVLKDGEAIKIVNNKNTNSALGGDPNTANNMWVDQDNQITYELVNGSTNEYYLSKDGVKIDVSWNYGGHLTGVNGKGFTKWAFIPKEKITDGSYALYKAKKEMYAVYSAISESAKETYSEVLNTAYSVYMASDATAQSVKDATKVLLGAVADVIETEVPANALFVHPDMVGEAGNIADWSTTVRNASWSEFEVYRSAFTLTQTANNIPNGLYKVVFHSLYRSDGSEAAPVLSVNEAYTASVPEMRTLNYGVDNGNNSNGWSNNNGWIPNNMQSCGQALAHDGAVAVINNIKVTDGTMTITVTENGALNWNNFQGFEVYYMGAINMALYKQLQEKVAVAEDLTDKHISVTVSNTLAERIDAAKLLTPNSDEADLENAMAALDDVIVSAQESIASNAILIAGEIPSNATNGWICTNGNFQANTWSVEGDTDGSNMKTPFLQVWKGAGNRLDNATVSYKLAGIEPGMYKVSVLARMLNERGNADGISGASLYANEDKISIDKGLSCTNGIYSNYSIIGTVGDDETLTIGIELKDVTFNWISFKDVKVEKLDEVTTTNMAELTGMVAEGAVYDATVKSEFEKMDVTPSKANYNNLSEYVHYVESSMSYYAEIKAVLDDFQKKYATLNANGETKTAYEALYNELLQVYTDGGIITAEFGTKADDLNTALVAVVKAQTAENSDMTLAIVNPSFETGNLNDGWTLTGTPGSSVDNGVKPNSNGTYTTTGCDGDYLLNVWKTGLALHQTITDMPNGVYQLTVACANTGATYKLMGKEVGTPEGNDARQFVDQTCKFEVSNNQIDLLLETVNNVWYKVDNFRLTYLGEVNVDYTALEETVAGINYELGFAKGQYAPYNNIEAISALAEAKALLTNKDAFEQETVDNCVNTLANATWTANTEEVNAVYDGNFAIQEAKEETENVVLAGWTTVSGNTRYLIKDVEKYPGLNDAVSHSGVFTHNGTYTYGQPAGYTMPLAANTVYELSFKHCGWNGANDNGFFVSVLNDAQEGLSETDMGTAANGINTAGALVNATIRFKTGAAGNYVLTFAPKANVTFTDISLLTAKAEDIAVKVSAEYGTMILPFDAEIPSNMEVYSVGSCSEQTEEYSVLNLQPVTDKIAANTPYIVKSDATDFTFNGIALNNGNAYTDGLLTGVMTATPAPKGSYVLQKQEGKLGFYLVETDDIIVPANRAYLTIPETVAANVRAFVFDLGNVTGINHVEAADALVNVYSIDGVLVRKAVKASEALNGLQKGIYVVNGAKKAVK